MKYFRYNRQRVIEEFLKSEHNSMQLDWEKMGYININSLRSSFSVLIENKKYPCYLLAIKGKIYLIRSENPNYSDIFTSPIYDQEIVKHNKTVKQNIENFVNSKENMVEIPWNELGYMTPTSAYNSYRTSVRRYKWDSEVKIQRFGDQVMMIKV